MTVADVLLGLLLAPLFLLGILAIVAVLLKGIGRL